MFLSPGDKSWNAADTFEAKLDSLSRPAGEFVLDPFGTAAARLSNVLQELLTLFFLSQDMRIET